MAQRTCAMLRHHILWSKKFQKSAALSSFVITGKPAPRWSFKFQVSSFKNPPPYPFVLRCAIDLYFFRLLTGEHCISSACQQAGESPPDFLHPLKRAGELRSRHRGWMRGCNPREKMKRRFGIVCLVRIVGLVCLVRIVSIVLFCQYFFLVIFVSKSILLSRHNLWSKKFQKLTATSSFFIHKVFRYCTAGMIGVFGQNSLLL